MPVTRTFRMPRLIFGQGASETVGEEVKKMGAEKVFLVTDETLRRLGTLEKIESSLKAEGLNFEIFDKLPTEPTVDLVHEGFGLFKGSGANIIVGVGGGTPIDTAKAISVLATNKGTIPELWRPDAIKNPGLSVVAIPTTAGSGAEGTICSVVADTKTGVKTSHYCPHLLPVLAIVDPLLTVSLPKPMTAGPGLDALTHAIEAYVSVKAWPMSDSMATSAIELIAANLPEAWRNGNNLEAREKTMLGAHQAGLAFSNASLILIHAMSRPLGPYFHVPHGVSNACLLSHVMQFTLMGNPERFAHIAALMGENIAGLSVTQAAQAAVDAVKRMARQLEIPPLRDLGVDKGKLDKVVRQMAKDAIASGTALNSPRIATEDEVIELYNLAY